MGGFHLSGMSRGELEKIISSFKKLGVRYAGPCHCSGDLTRQMFEEEYKKNFIEYGVGKIVEIN